VLTETEQQATELDRWLTDWIETEVEPIGSEVELADDMQSRLADLGYLDHEM